MKIKNLPMMNDFVAFWFDTSVDDNIRYRTWIDYINKSWKTVDLENEETVVVSGGLSASLSLDEEKQEEQRIRDHVAQIIRRTNRD